MNETHKLKIRHAPHFRSSLTGQKIMLMVIIALIPAAITGVYFFGLNALWIIITTVCVAWLTDIFMQFLIKKYGKIENRKKKYQLVNFSSILTGLLLALVLPPGINPFFGALGSFIAVSIGKYAFGKGNNIFNPALIARTILVFSFPAFMNKWIIPADSITGATPLSIANQGVYCDLLQKLGTKAAGYKAVIIGNIGGSIGETSVIALLIGAAFLLAYKIIDWRIPFGFIGTVLIISSFTTRDPFLEIFTGGIMIGAFFMATDYVTSPITKNGRWIFAIGCGALTMLFRMYSSYPEGVAFSIILMNAASPLIERYTIPKPFGAPKNWFEKIIKRIKDIF